MRFRVTDGYGTAWIRRHPRGGGLEWSVKMEESDHKRIEISPIGFVRRASSDQDVKDRDLVSEIVLARISHEPWMA